MAIIKKGKIASNMTVSSVAYVCDSCGYTKVIKNNLLKDIKCKKCSNGKMTIVSAGFNNIDKEIRESRI